jgi:hypothetical protein
MGMRNIAIFFDNLIDSVPFALVHINGRTRVVRDFRRLEFPIGTITLGYRDCIDSFRRLKIKPIKDQIRLEIVYSLTIEYSKGDQSKKWAFKKQDIIGKNINPIFLKNIKRYDNGEIGWEDYSKELFSIKTDLLEAVEKTYCALFDKYVDGNKYKEKWLSIEYIVDNYFISNQYYGINVDNEKIKESLFTLNFEKYSSLLFLEKNYGIDISSSFISDEKISELTLVEYNENERTEELADLIQVINENDKRIEAISKVKECRIDYANLIKHYSLDVEQKVFPQYETIGSSSGRIFLSSPGTQYLKKTKRDIFVASDGFQIAYFDFRNYEPGIAAGLSRDPKFIEYYSTGDMYLRIANESQGNEEKRKSVKISVLSYLYGMSRESLRKYFEKEIDFNPDFVVDILENFSVFTKWKNRIISMALKNNVIHDKSYTRRFLPNKEWKIKTSALNHVIQSTGSRILKRCIAEVGKIEGVRILVPMHDALLCEINSGKYDDLKKKVIVTMEKIFTQEVVKTNSKVIVSNIFA